MALTRASKTEKVGKLAAELEHSTSAIIGTFKGLTAAKDFELRKAVRGAGGSYHVVKNKLAARAADPVALAKALSTWVKDNAEFTFKLGIIDGKVIDVREIGELATMPGKEELFSKLLFLINSPAQRLATVINATGRNLAVVINQGVEKGKFAGPPAAAAPAAPVEEAPAAPEAKVEAPAAEAAPATEAAPAAEAASAVEVAPAAEATAHVEESAAGEQPSGAAQPENSTASQGGEAATTDPVEG
jgi:large subunit ribosomal protein L10